MPTVIEVPDPADSRLDEYRSLTDVALRRRQEPRWGLFLAESARVIRRALSAGYPPRSALTSSKWLPEIRGLLGDWDVPIYVGDSAVLRELTGYHVHRGALAAMHRRPLPSLSEAVAAARRIAVLEGIVDHTNVGAAFRSVAALGFDGVVIDPSCADPLYRRSVRVSMGTVFSVPWTRLSSWPNSLDELHQLGFTLLAMDPGGTTDLAEVPTRASDRLAILMGTEGDGLSEAALARVDMTVRIPMAPGVDSLNMAAATAVACYALGGGDSAKMEE